MALYSALFLAIDRDDLNDKFRQLIVQPRFDQALEDYLEEIESKEETGEIRHIPKGRGNLGDSEMAFGEIVREALIGNCMFNFVGIEVRNFVIDQIMTAESQEKDLN